MDIPRVRARPANVKPFAAIPHELVDDARLSPRAVMLAGVLLRYARNKPDCWPSNATLARDCRCSARTVQLCLAALESAGWIRRTEADNRTGRLIVLAWREPAPAPKPVAPRPATPVAPELQNQGNRQRPPSASEGRAAGTERETPAPDLATLHQWAEGRDPILARIARKLLADRGGRDCGPVVDACSMGVVVASARESDPRVCEPTSRTHSGNSRSTRRAVRVRPDATTDRHVGASENSLAIGISHVSACPGSSHVGKSPLMVEGSIGGALPRQQDGRGGPGPRSDGLHRG